MQCQKICSRLTLDKALLVGFALSAPLIASTLLLLSMLLPTAQEVIDARPPESSLLYDRYGALLYRFYDQEDRISISIDEMPAHLLQAVIAIEDREFYAHHGFSFTGFARALRNNFRQGALVEGGSTISQQLVKNRVLSADKTLLRKGKELILALKLEFALGKKQILELYLNQVAMGGTSYGVEAAAIGYFGKSARDLTLSESAFLAGLLKAPSTYSPFRRGSTAHLHRRRVVLNRMREEGFIDANERWNALDEPLKFARARVKLEAPHFTHYVRRILGERLDDFDLRKDGLRIHSTLNLGLHRGVQTTVTKEVSSLFRHWVGNGAVLVTNPATGDILSMVGSTNYFDDTRDGAVNATLALRQPGSAIKPLTYAMSLSRGKTAATLLSDKPIALDIPDEGQYSPRNIDFDFQGDVSLRKALAASRNVPAVNELVEIGVGNYVDKAEQFGIRSWQDQSAYRYALTLGSGEVRMLDMATLFSSFANLGYPTLPDPILRVESREGELLYAKDCSEQGCYQERAFSSGVAFLINSILSDNKARASTFGVGSLLEIAGHEVAVKTGTTDLLRDNWAVGYTSNHLVAVWIGNNDGSPMRFIHSGGPGASSIWNKVMRRILITKPPHRFPIPEDIVRARWCGDSSRPQCGNCGKAREEYFIRGSEPEGACI